MPDKPPPKKISAKAIMADLKSGMTDAELTAKYGIRDNSAGKQRKVCSSGQPDDMVKEIDRYRG